MLPIECEAITLGVKSYGEADKIVTLFTLEQGKLTAIARNAKRSRKRFAGCLEIFTRLRAQIVLKDGLSRMDSADAITIFPHIREDLAKIAHAGYACEVIDRLLPEAQPNQRLYRLIIAYLDFLNSAPATAVDRRFFEVNLLNVLGYRLPVETCGNCRVMLDSVLEMHYDAASGAILCDRCSRTGLKISADALSFFRLVLRTGRFGKAAISGKALKEVGEALDAAIASHLSRPLCSIEFLKEVSELGIVTT